MNNYQHILLATDFSEHSRFVELRAKELATHYQSQLSIIHIIDDLPLSDASYGPVIPFDVELLDEIMMTAKQRLVKISKALEIDSDSQYLEFGSPKLDVIRIAKEKAIDLIVFGSHGRHGLSLLLGSTANSIMHHAPCDVLAVRLKDN